MNITIPSFPSIDEKLKWLVYNKNTLMNQKKATTKFADSCIVTQKNGDYAIKAINGIPKDAPEIEVVPVINTTKLFDSHGDVHIDGIWNKSISEARKNYLVKEHDFTFDGIITDNVSVSTKQILWNDLGYKFQGETQALLYKSVISKDDQTGMFGRYLAGKVDQHSVGMRYIKMALAIDQKKYADEKAIWDKYYSQIVNKEDVDDAGFFWAITEAKNFEGSAVVRGSNFVTPTLSTTEPGKSTQVHEPHKSTRKISIDEALLKFNP